MGRFDELARRETILFAALEYFAGKRYSRDKLEPVATPVKGTINATVGRAQLAVPFSGLLKVAEDGESASSSAPDTAHLVGYLLGQLDETKRSRLIANLVAEFEVTKELPIVPPERTVEAELLLKRLRSSIVKPKRGSVVFAID